MPSPFSWGRAYDSPVNRSALADTVPVEQRQDDEIVPTQSIPAQNTTENATEQAPPPIIELVGEYSTIPARLSGDAVLNVLTTIKSPAMNVTANVDVSVDLVVLVDVSGSMMGEKLENVKTTLRYILDSLDEKDRISLVQFSNFATKLTGLRRPTIGNKAALGPVISAMQPIAGTAIYQGLVEAVKVLTDRTSSNQCAAVLLLSDGGESYHVPDQTYQTLLASARDQRISLYAFGYGAQHDAAKMNMIASGSGSFQYVEQPSVIQDAFAGCLGSLKTTMYENVRMTIRVASSLSRSVTIRDIKAGLYKQEIGADKTTGIITLPNMFAEETRDFVIELGFASGTPEGNTSLEVLEVDCGYRDAIQGSEVLHLPSGAVKFSVGRHEANVHPDPNVRPNPIVVKQSLRCTIGDCMERATSLADRRDYSGALAALSECRASVLQTIAFTYGLSAADVERINQRPPQAPASIPSADWVLYNALLADLHDAMPRVRSQASYSSGGSATMQQMWTVQQSQRVSDIPLEREPTFERGHQDDWEEVMGWVRQELARKEEVLVMGYVDVVER
ncbi:hypothetical protein HK104_001977 [Borealophlyctis nickersoniae]|nr:hypothetical protein HK104_001977 [Borealophlyctis nickersoniae]